MGADIRRFGSIGIIGAGHLGGTLALEMIAHGLDPESLFISSTGSAQSRERLRLLGLEKNIASNESIASSCDFVFATLRPRGWELLADLEFAPDVTILSTIAGVSAERVAELTRRRCVHVMPSGPDSIRDGKGLCAIFPPRKDVVDLLGAMGMSVVSLESEEEMYGFTAAVCLPAVAVVAQSMGIDLDAQWSEVEHEFPKLAETVRWARAVAPILPHESDRRAYVERMATKGGITERIVDSFRAGQSMGTSLANGIARCREIAQASR